MCHTYLKVGKVQIAVATRHSMEVSFVRTQDIHPNRSEISLPAPYGDAIRSGDNDPRSLFALSLINIMTHRPIARHRAHRL